MPVSFPVDQVKPEVFQTAYAEIGESIRSLCGVQPEACSANFQGVFDPTVRGIPDRGARLNGFLRAVHEAFANHYPLTLSPDDVWLAISQGFSYHVNANAESLRSQFVKHEGKATIKVRRDDFIKGSPNNDWPGCFAEFSHQIAGYIGKDKLEFITGNFSTSSPLTRAVSEVTLMNTLKAYFKYVVITRCGIPSITLEGTVDDWNLILMKAAALAEFGCREWITSLLTVLNNFVSAFRGSADPSFWTNIYKMEGPRGSGGTSVSGWVNVFFPYLSDWRNPQEFSRPNPCATSLANKYGVHPDQFPTGLTSTPFIWDYYETLINMQFLAGFVGVTQDAGAVRPVQGWGVAEA